MKPHPSIFEAALRELDVVAEDGAYVGGVIDIEAMRDHRARAQWDNWLKDLRTELYQIVYKDPIYPKNLYMDRAPYNHAEYKKEVTDKQIALMHKRDIWKKPAR